MKKIASILVFTFMVVGASFGQGYRVPRNYSFESKDSYHKYDKDIIRFANWIEKVVPGEDKDYVRQGSRFFYEWLTGCNYVQFKPNVRIDGMLADHPEFKLYYQAGWARYALKNAGAKKEDCSYAGLKLVLKVYLENRAMFKDKNLDELAKYDDEDRLKNWIKQKFEQ